MLVLAGPNMLPQADLHRCDALAHWSFHRALYSVSSSPTMLLHNHPGYQTPHPLTERDFHFHMPRGKDNFMTYSDIDKIAAFWICIAAFLVMLGY